MSLCLLLATTFPLSAQQEGAVIRSQVRQIFVPVTVSNMEDKPITDLKKSDFHLYEDGVEQDIVNFAQEQVPLNVVFLMDISGSTFLELGAIKKAVRTFVEHLEPQDRVAIVTFNNEARLILDWSNDMTRLDRALDRVVPKGSTVWYDAVYVTLKDLLPPVKGKKVIISVTDGWDTGSLVSFHDLLDEITASDVQMYIVSKTSSLRDYAEYVRQTYGGRYDETQLMKIMYQSESQLKKLAWETGGRVIDPGSTGNLEKIYKDLVQELRMQYYISYRPHNIMRDGNYRKITVRVDRMGVKIHHRPGYYAR